MTDKLKQIIKEETGKLQKEMQEAINSLNWAKIAEDVGEKYFLDEAKTNDFQVETLLVLVGLTPPEFYPICIENQVGTTKAEAENMAKEANEKIFTPIYNVLVENIKNKMKDKNPTWEQTVNFILSGGNYAVFVENRPREE